MVYAGTSKLRRERWCLNQFPVGVSILLAENRVYYMAFWLNRKMPLPGEKLSRIERERQTRTRQTRLSLGLAFHSV